MAKTIVDIAKLAGVAKSTVSRYLNGGYVSNKTKRKLKVLFKKRISLQIHLRKV